METGNHVTVAELLLEARAGLERLDPAQASAALSDGAILIDIRSEWQRSRDGRVPGARFFPRNVLEWRLDPASEHRDPEAARRDVLLILMCDEGFQSSLAAATLTRLGLRLTDLIGGFQAWRSAGLPVESAD
jgi:rhodanese-related sulfurtransferase